MLRDPRVHRPERNDANQQVRHDDDRRGQQDPRKRELRVIRRSTQVVTPSATAAIKLSVDPTPSSMLASTNRRTTSPLANEGATKARARTHAGPPAREDLPRQAGLAVVGRSFGTSSRSSTAGALVDVRRAMAPLGNARAQLAIDRVQDLARRGVARMTRRDQYLRVR